jgi:hypothetical protein
VLFHQVAAHDGWATRHASLAVHQHIPTLSQMIINEVKSWLIEPCQFGLFAILAHNEHVLLTQSKLLHFLLNLLLHIRLLVHDSQNSSNTLFEYDGAYRFLCAKV